MADVLNRTTRELVRSANTPDYPVADWVHGPDLSGVEGWDSKYWKLSGDNVLLMTPSERADVDAAEAAARASAEKAAAVAAVDNSGDPATRLLDGVGRLVQAEIQALKAAVQQIADELGVTLDPPLRPSPTMEQLREALKGLVQNG